VAWTRGAKSSRLCTSRLKGKLGSVLECKISLDGTGLDVMNEDVGRCRPCRASEEMWWGRTKLANVVVVRSK